MAAVKPVSNPTTSLVSSTAETGKGLRSHDGKQYTQVSSRSCKERYRSISRRAKPHAAREMDTWKTSDLFAMCLPGNRSLVIEASIPDYQYHQE